MPAAVSLPSWLGLFPVDPGPEDDPAPVGIEVHDATAIHPVRMRRGIEGYAGRAKRRGCGGDRFRAGEVQHQHVDRIDCGHLAAPPHDLQLKACVREPEDRAVLTEAV